MDFFASQDQARRKTRRLIFFYILAVLLIVAMIYLVVAALFLYGQSGAPHLETLWDPELFLWVSLSVVLVIMAGSFYRIMGLRSGGVAVAEMMGGRRVNPSTIDPEERKLINVVEEMAIASGIPVPEIFVIDGEEGINAFAAGHSVSDAAVGVTRGCIRKLTRSELQGVIAHEFSHILNGDMRLNIRLIGILNGILLLHIIGYILFRSTLFAGGRHQRGNRGKGNGAALAIPLIGLALMVIGYIGVFFSRLIQSAVSREREYLADASAVQFTRNPAGIAGALQKIGGWRGSRVKASHTLELSHMFFSSALRPSLAGLFSTHPPLEKRIQAIDPSFEAPKAAKKRRPNPSTERSSQTTGASSLFGERTLSTNSDTLIDGVGTLHFSSLLRTRQIFSDIPDAVLTAVHNPLGAKALIYGLLLAREGKLRTEQLQLLQKKAEMGVYPELERILPFLIQMDASFRLPLVDLALPALRQLSPGQYTEFRKRMEELVQSDGKISLFEFTLEKILLRHLSGFFDQKTSSRASIHNFSSLKMETAVLLSALARTADKDAEKAFAVAVKRLPGSLVSLRLLPATETSMGKIDHALSRLGSASLPIKKQFLESALSCISFDGKISLEEGELIRAIADGIDCPMPPSGHSN